MSGARPRPPLPAGPYLIVGLARSGTAAALALRQRGEEVIGWDAGGPAARDLAATAGRLSSAGVEVVLDVSGNGLAARAGAVVKSPGVPPDIPILQAARARGLPVLGELELAWRLLDNPFVAVTGTNGKTTTTEWIGHIHRVAGRPVAVAGNVGTAACTLVGAVSAEATVICEASSFQLEDTSAFAPEVAVLLNLTPDHLDRHGSFAAYRAAKLRIFANQGDGDVAVVPTGFELGPGGAGRRIHFGPSPGGAADETGLFEREGQLWWAGRPLVAVDRLALPGEHNRQNAMAAAAACLAGGIEREAVAEGLQTFAGVPHRLEPVADRHGVRWINDSKATNVASAAVALRSFPGRVHLIAGGRGKGQDFRPLAPLVGERCAAVYLIGEAAGELAEALVGTGVPVHRVGDLGRAVEAARRAAVPGEVVLLSPACASFDQYPDFEARGEHFRALVEELQ